MRYLGLSAKILGVVIIVGFCGYAATVSFNTYSRAVKRTWLQKYAGATEDKFYDIRSGFYRSRHEPEVNNDVILVKIDDQSLQKINSWPLPRETWATLLERLKGYGAKIAAFDVFFPEPALACSADKNPDAVFAQAIRDFQSVNGNKVILSFTTSTDPETQTFKQVPMDVMFRGVANTRRAAGFDPFTTYIDRNTYPVESVLAGEPHLGSINMDPDVDGVFRHYKLTSSLKETVVDIGENGEKVEDVFYTDTYSLGLNAVNSVTGQDLLLEFDPTGSGHINLGRAPASKNEDFLRLNELGETKIRWHGGLDKFANISLHEVLFADPADKKLKKFFNNKIVFVGSTALGAHDLRNSPVDPQMPGVLAHMNLVHMIMHNYVYAPLKDSLNVTMTMFILGILALLSVMYFNKALLDIIALVVIGAVILIVDYQIYLPQGYELKLFFTLLALGSTYAWITILNFNQASAEKKMIKGAFSRYVAPAIVDDMLDHPDKLKVGGEKRDITCLFSDVRDFTSISEQLTPSDLGWALNRYMGKMTDIVFETNGTLDKYIGDAIVAFWGAPIDIGDHVTQAVDAAVKMLEALPEVNKELAAKGLPEFKIGLGLNSGECSVGNMGSDQIFAYTALGDAMNLGARLESLCKHYGAQILISEFTRERMEKDRFVTRQIDKVRVKGKKEPVGVHEVLYSYHPLYKEREFLDLFNDSYQKFLDKKFDEAKEGFEKVLAVFPEDKSSQRMIESCEKWLEIPPAPGEDHTITTMTTK